MLYRDLEDDALEIPDDPARVFGEVVERNDRVCRNCYRRLRRKATFPQTAGLDYGDVLSYVDWVSPTGSEWDLLDREYYERLTLPQRLGPAYSDDGKTSYCRNCGTMDPHRTPTTRSKQNARDVAINLTTTLHELGIDHDWVYLVERVVELKSQPDTAGDDFACFRRATAEAIQTVKEE
jgi:hypothetical protein